MGADMTRKKQSSDERRASLTDSIFAAAQGSEPKASRKESPSIVGAALGTHSEGLSSEVKRLKAERDAAIGSGQLLMEIECDLIRDPLPRDRLEASFESESFAELKRSIEQDGQLIPITVRGNAQDGYEIAAGRRRLEACRQLNMPVLARIQSLDDSEMLQLQYQENEQRADISSFERALWYRDVQRRYDFSTPELAKRFGVSQPMIVKYLKLARIPDVIVKVLDDPRDLSLGDSEKLHKAIDRQSAKALAADAVVQQGQGTKSQVKAMLTVSKATKVKKESAIREVRKGDAVVAQLSTKRKNLVISLSDDLDAEAQERLLTAMEKFLVRHL